MSEHPNNFPKLHNASWPGVVGKEPDTDHPPIDLETMLDYTASAEVDGVKFDGTDLFLFDPHVSIDSGDDDLKKLADQVTSRNLVIGSVVAPVWEPTGGGSAMDEGEGRTNFLQQVRKGCGIAKKLRELVCSAFFVEDHYIHFFFLGGPDFVVGPDASPAQRNILG
ncbi:MAG: hypothetical protein N2C14_00955, partial [Planctomycetales bacterium]